MYLDSEVYCCLLAAFTMSAIVRTICVKTDEIRNAAPPKILSYVDAWVLVISVVIAMLLDMNNIYNISPIILCAGFVFKAIYGLKMRKSTAVPCSTAEKLNVFLSNAFTLVTCICALVFIGIAVVYYLK